MSLPYIMPDDQEIKRFIHNTFSSYFSDDHDATGTEILVDELKCFIKKILDINIIPSPIPSTTSDPQPDRKTSQNDQGQ